MILAHYGMVLVPNKVRLGFASEFKRNKGKRGGYRVIYFIKQKEQTILLAAYSKNEQSIVSAEFLHKLIDKYKI